MQKRKRILIICPYPLHSAPSQRFRFEQYLDVLSAQGFEVEIKPFFSASAWEDVKSKRSSLTTALVVLQGLLGRCRLLFRVSQFDFVFIHREAAPVGPPFFEWMCTRIFKRKIIYDFDDAIWLTDKTGESMLSRFIRVRSKVRLICRWAYKVSCGNHYLMSFALKQNAAVFLIPTTIDTVRYHNPSLYGSEPRKDRVTIGWTGSQSTLKYLEPLERVFNKLAEKFPQVDFIFIADQPPRFNIPRMTFIPWAPQTEIPALRKIDIGIMPLPDDEWSRGKGGFKALQYLAMEIPAVVSPVGINSEIVKNDANGYLASSVEEWMRFLTLLVENSDSRKRLGTQGRIDVIENYSVEAITPRFLNLFV